MLKLPNSVKEAIDELSSLPSIGPRQATRLILHLTTRYRAGAIRLSQALSALAAVKVCTRCNFIHEEKGELCYVCADPNRDKMTVMVLEKETDLMSMERSGKYLGTYFVLGDVPKTGIFEQEQRQQLGHLKEVLNSLPNSMADEVILAFNPTSHGDFAAETVLRELAGLSKEFSRLGRGLPTGGEIEFADPDTLAGSLDRRK
jgi:recombination protein RecR